MKIVAGLGNPGAQYADTPHSVGFETVDRLAAAAGAAWEEKRAFRCVMARCVLAGQPTLLVKPQTFMNLSGESVAPVVKYHNATPADLVVVQDDIDLPVGRIRVRAGGSHGGHNGIRNIIERLGTDAFARVKQGRRRRGRARPRQVRPGDAREDGCRRGGCGGRRPRGASRRPRARDERLQRLDAPGGRAVSVANRSCGLSQDFVYCPSCGLETNQGKHLKKDKNESKRIS